MQGGWAWPPPPGAPPWWYPPPSGGPVGSGRYRARGIPELIDASFALYRLCFGTVVALGAVVTVPVAVLRFVVSRAGDLSGHVDSVNRVTTAVNAQQGGITQAQRDQLLSDGTAIVVALALTLALSVVAQQVTVAALSHVVSERHLDRDAGFGDGLRAVGARLLPLLGGVLLEALPFAVLVAATVAVVAAGVPALAIVTGIAAVAAGVVLPVRWWLMPQVIVLERAAPFTALRRSWRLTRRRYWRTLGMVLLFSLVTGIVSGVLGGIATLATLGASTDVQLAASTAASAVIGVLVTPVTVIGYVLYYYDVRIRDEAFDLEMVAASL